jgi:hypothetical protein
MDRQAAADGVRVCGACPAGPAAGFARKGRDAFGAPTPSPPTRSPPPTHNPLPAPRVPLQYMATDSEADAAVSSLNGAVIDGYRVRVERSAQRRPGGEDVPTPAYRIYVRGLPRVDNLDVGTARKIVSDACGRAGAGGGKSIDRIRRARRAAARPPAHLHRSPLPIEFPLRPRRRTCCVTRSGGTAR